MDYEVDDDAALSVIAPREDTEPDAAASSQSETWRAELGTRSKDFNCWFTKLESSLFETSQNFVNHQDIR